MLQTDRTCLLVPRSCSGVNQPIRTPLASEMCAVLFVAGSGIRIHSGDLLLCFLVSAHIVVESRFDREGGLVSKLLPEEPNLYLKIFVN